MNCPPLRARAFGSDAASARSGVSALYGFAGAIPAFRKIAGAIPAMRGRAGRVGIVGENRYHLERTTPTA